MNEKARNLIPWVVLVAAVGGLVTYRNPWLDPNRSDSPGPASAAGPAFSAWPPAPALPTTAPRPTTDAALPGGGTFIGSRCGTKNFHHFTPPVTPVPEPTGRGERRGRRTPGPQLVLGSYGFGRHGVDDQGEFTIDLLLGPGTERELELSGPLGPEGVAVEIEGPEGIVGGAYGLPVTLSDDEVPSPEGKVRITPGSGGSAGVTLPAQALCPGYDGFALQRVLVAPLDSSNTIIGDPPYRLTVSISDPAVGALRRASGSPLTGDVLSADNRIDPAQGSPADGPARAAV
ncbi:hypothetical protein ACFWA9_27155 [Kitasatospora sp. NPDC059973]|uniref:hypothetical protein n=1 Tax=Kitasatospora sp. NPDC059973 TaxID=3347020 RepID=UPI0036AF24AF